MGILVLSSSAKTVQAGKVAGMVSVREVEPGNGHTSIDQFLELFHLPTGGSEGTDNLCSPGGNIRSIRDGLEVDVRSTKFGSVV
mmetsp:Transcript_20105/g.29972  ORF Transcript_20105/g.29972 Transcript_20105/m.29972 type:complete len:84 (-) Transcript_20105:55-306(-)